MSLQPCKTCGVGFDLEWVPMNPFKVCPNCKSPLEAAAVDVMHVDSEVARETLHARVADVSKPV